MPGYKLLLLPNHASPFDLNLRHLQALAVITDLGSIQAASHAAGLSQPALTQGVAQLERQFGIRLFDRHPQGLRPSDAGARVLLRVRHATERLRREMRALARTRSASGPAAPHLTSAQVRALLSLRDAGSITAAAHAVGLAEPSVHRALRALETRCGVALTERRGRAVHLSEAGRRLARGFALATRELAVALQEAAAEPGQISIGTMALPRSMLLPVALADLSEAVPGAEVDVLDGSYGELAEALRGGAIDIVLGALRETPDPDLRQEELLTDRITVIGRRGHPLAGRYSSLEELARYPWIVGRRTSALLERWQRIFDESAISRPRAPIQCGSVTTIRGLLVRSDFLTLLSRDQVTAELDTGLLVAIRSRIPDTLRTIGVITRADWLPTELQLRFLETLREAAKRIG